jgi:hypothetical protein
VPRIGTLDFHDPVWDVDRQSAVTLASSSDEEVDGLLVNLALAHHTMAMSFNHPDSFFVSEHRRVVRIPKPDEYEDSETAFAESASCG